jgi:hypothetical protein
MLTDLQRKYYDIKSDILRQLHTETFNGSNPDGAWDLMRKFYDVNMLNALHFSNSDLLDPYTYSDTFDGLKDTLLDAITIFYNNNPKLLSDDFTLNNNYYNVDLRCFIVDVEDMLKQDKRDN